MKSRNPSIATRAEGIFNFKTGESLEEVEPKIQPVVQILPSIEVISLSAVNSTGGTILDTPADKDLYVVAAQLTSEQNATATNSETNISATINGRNTQLLALKRVSSSGWSDSVALQFPFRGVKIDRGTPITISNTTATAQVTSKAIIYFYTEETINDLRN